MSLSPQISGFEAGDLDITQESYGQEDLLDWEQRKSIFSVLCLIFIHS